VPREYPATCGRHSHAPHHCVLLLQHKEEAQLLRAGEVRLQEDETTCSLLAQLHRAGLQLLTSCTVIGTHSLGRLSLSLSRNDARCLGRSPNVFAESQIPSAAPQSPYKVDGRPANVPRGPQVHTAPRRPGLKTPSVQQIVPARRDTRCLSLASPAGQLEYQTSAPQQPFVLPGRMADVLLSSCLIPLFLATGAFALSDSIISAPTGRARMQLEALVSALERLHPQISWGRVGVAITLCSIFPGFWLMRRTFSSSRSSVEAQRSEGGIMRHSVESTGKT